MSNLIAIAYPEQARAAEALEAIKRLQSEGAIDLDDAVALTKDEVGRVTVEGATSHTAQGALGGLLLGAVLGSLVVAPVLGALFGAAAGALTGQVFDVGRIDDFVTEVGDRLQPGSSALLMLVRSADPDKTLTALQKYGATVIRTTLPDDAEARIQAALRHSAA